MPTRPATPGAKSPKTERGEPSYLQGAVVVVENRTGAVLAVVGGRNANESRFNRATDANRQLGSIFKPFVYLAAFDKGLRPDTMISDAPIAPGEIKGGGTWRPANSDGKYGGMQAGFLRPHPLAQHDVRAGRQLRRHPARPGGRRQGRLHHPGASQTVLLPRFLGGHPWEVATAYTIFPNAGVRFRPYLISEIKDRAGNILYSTLPLSYQAASSGSAWSVSRILNEVTTSGTAASVQRLGFDKPCAGKTGTTNDFKDAWFAGYTSTLTCAVWCGFDIPKKTFQGAYGATLSLPVWVDIMKTADNLGYKAGTLHSKINLVAMDLCRLSQKRATAGCKEAGTTYTDQVPADIALPDNDFCPLHPARAQTVDESAAQAHAATADTPMRAHPVEEPNTPLRALPVDEPPPHAEPVDEPE